MKMAIHKLAADSAGSSARYVTGMAVVFLVGGTALLFLGTIAWLGFVLLLFALYFFLMRKRYKRIQELHLNADATGPALDEASVDEVDHERSVQIDVGGSVGLLEVVGHGPDSDCFDRIVSQISLDRVSLSQEFDRFKEAAVKKYPEWASEVFLLEIERLEIFPDKRRCVATVWFKGERGEFWRSEFDGKRFSSLVWM